MGLRCVVLAGTSEGTRESKSSFLCFEEADVCVRIVSGSSGNSVFEVRSR